VQVNLPWVTDAEANAYAPWARIATLMAGQQRGAWFIPEPEDEVLVAFEAGDPRRPIVVGALWNGVDVPPERMDRNNNIRSITSRSGIRVTIPMEAFSSLSKPQVGKRWSARMPQPVLK
jgi:uncharacterized protein involved in type VI secretion and phage assembly